MTKFLTAAEIGKILRLPRRTVYKFAQEGQLPGTLRIGKHWRFSEKAIRKWLAEETARKRRAIVK